MTGVAVGRHAGFRPELVLEDAVALAALRRVAEAMRTGLDGPGPLADLACGRPVGPADLAQVVDAEGVAALVRAGAAVRTEDGVALTFGMVAGGATVAVSPFPASASDLVYFGPDSMWLVHALWRRAAGGAAAVELGTGTGFVAAFLASRYRAVVATEVDPAAASVARLTLALGRERAGHASVACVADVAAGLRPGAFDLVTGNPPWVPVSPDRPGRVFADGGATGFELPRRFLLEGAGLLAPGGLLVMVMLDPTYVDGSNPLAGTRAELERAGFGTEVHETAARTAIPDFEERLRDRFAHVAAARHVAVIVARDR